MDKFILPLLTEKDLAGWLGLSLPSLQRMRANRTGPQFVRVSERRIGYRKEDVEAWIASRTVDHIGHVPTAEPGNATH